MKGIFSILLCAFLLLQSGILSFQYVFKIIHHKRVVENGIRNGAFNNCLITFTSAELLNARWENDHEFFIGKDKFDVVKRSERNGESVYACINDKAEKALINDLDKSKNKSSLVDELLKKFKIILHSVFNSGIVKLFPDTLNPYAYFHDSYSFLFFSDIDRPPVF